MSIWSPVTLIDGVWLRGDIGPLHIWIRRQRDEWHIASQRQSEDSENCNQLTVEKDAPPPPEELPVRRWLLGAENDLMRLVPALPERPVVVRPEVVVNLHPGGAGVFFVSVPLWIQVTAGANGEQVLCEEATVELSNTWFGTPEEGESCYSLRSRALRNLSDHSPSVCRAICPVRVENAGEEGTELQRLCVRVPHLTLYQGLTRLWTTEVCYRFTGEAAPTEIEYKEKPTVHETISGLLRPPRLIVDSSTLGRGFQTFRNLAGF